MDDKTVSPREIKYSAKEALDADALMKISAALACARKLRDEGRRLEFDSRGGLMVYPPLNGVQQQRLASSAALLEKLLCPERRQWAEYMDGALLFIEQLVAAGAQPRVVDGHLVADLADDSASMRTMMEFYGPAAIQWLRAQAIARAEEERSTPWWQKVVAWR